MEGDQLRFSIFCGGYYALFDRSRPAVLQNYEGRAVVSFRSRLASGIFDIANLYREVPASHHELRTLQAGVDPMGHTTIVVGGWVFFLNELPSVFSQVFHVRPAARGDFSIFYTIYFTVGPAPAPAPPPPPPPPAVLPAPVDEEEEESDVSENSSIE